jgi:hypothetical protein
LRLLVTLFPAVTLTLAEDQSRSNKSEESNPFSVELPILKQDLSGDRLAPEAPGAALKQNWKKQNATPKAWKASANVGCF